MSWAAFPALGFNLTFDLPDLAKRGWLYWVVLVVALTIPLALMCIVAHDDGNIETGGPILAIANTMHAAVRRALRLPEADHWILRPAKYEDRKVRGPGAGKEIEISAEAAFRQTAKRNAKMILAASVAIGATLVGVGVGHDKTQLLGFGVLIGLLGVGSYAWERAKLVVLESHLQKVSVNFPRRMRISIWRENHL